MEIIIGRILLLFVLSLFSLFSFKTPKDMKAMGVSLVYAMLVRGSVLNFGLLPDFIVDYLILFLNEGNGKFLIYYYNWYYFRIYCFTVIQKLSNSYSVTNSSYNWKSNRFGSLIE